MPPKSAIPRTVEAMEPIPIVLLVNSRIGSSASSPIRHSMAWNATTPSAPTT